MLFRHIAFSLMLGVLFPLYSQQSISGNIPSYVEICLKASIDPYYFQTFRSNPLYAEVVECGLGGESASYILSSSSEEIRGKLADFRLLDQIGNPTTNDISGVGRFSGTTLRYIVVADHIDKLFSLPQNATIAEIGAGFGGQCFILSQLNRFAKYYIYDLPEAQALINTVLKTLSVSKAACVPFDEALPVEKIDLLISNYAYSECDLPTQLDYFERIVLKADRGYMLFNQTGGALTPDNFIDMLESHNMFPRIYEEPIFSYTGNKLIVWDKTSLPK